MKLKNHNANDNETAQAGSFSHELVYGHTIFIPLVTFRPILFCTQSQAKWILISLSNSC